MPVLQHLFGPIHCTGRPKIRAVALVVTRQYSCTDETGLLYSAIPDTTLATRGRKGTKVQTAKDRLTVLLCCNDTGDDKIDSLVIGKAACPTAFGPKKGGWEPSSVHVQYTLHGQSR